MEDASWRPLQLSNHSNDQPDFLLKAHFASDSYGVLVTDMNGHLWSQTATKRDIYKQSLMDDCSIDVSENEPHNFRMLLSKLEGALDATADNECRLDKTGENVTLHVSIAMPAGFQKLEWSFSLLAQPARFFDEFVRPLICAAYGQRLQANDLIEELGHKDHVIESILNRLQATGLGITSVFPAVKTDDRAQAARHIKGLGRFDKKGWQQSAFTRPADDLSVVSMIAALSSTVKGGSTQGEGEKQSPKAWMSNGASLPSRIAETPLDPAKEPADQSQTDDEFQRQATPPALNKAKDKHIVHSTSHKKQPKQTVESSYKHDETTDDEDDLDAHSSSKAEEPLRATSPTVPPTPKPRGKLGALGRRKAGTPADIVQPPTATPAVEQQDPETTDDDRDEKDHPIKVFTPPGTAALPKKAKLGALGGRKKAALATSESKSSTPVLTADPAGHDHSLVAERSSSSIHIKRETASLAPRTESGVPPVSSQEKADEKRAALKRQLEEAKTKPAAKKKRRF